MQPHQQRVVDEKVELDTKIAGLESFFNNPIFKGLEVREAERLSRQHVVMKEYSDILAERIAAF